MEKRVLYGLVVMLMYMVGSGVGEGEVKLMSGDEGKWKQFLTTTQLPVVLTLASSRCGFPCVVLEDQVSRLAQTYGDKDKFYTADILAKPFFVQLYKVVNVPTLIVFKDGQEIIRFESLSDWGNIYNDLVFASILNSTQPPSGSALPSAGSALRPSGSTTPSSGSALTPSGSTTPSSGSALPPSGSATPSSGSAMPSSGSTSPSSSSSGQ